MRCDLVAQSLRCIYKGRGRFGHACRDENGAGNVPSGRGFKPAPPYFHSGRQTSVRQGGGTEICRHVILLHVPREEDGAFHGW